MKIFLFICCIFISLQLNASETPNWVKSIRTGNNVFKLNQGNKVYFRANFKGNRHSDQETLCQNAIEKDEEYIRKNYPYSDKIPMTVEVSYYDENENDCSVTISVPKNFEEKDNALKEQKAKYEKKLDKKEKENKQLKQDLENASRPIYVTQYQNNIGEIYYNPIDRMELLATLEITIIYSANKTDYLFYYGDKKNLQCYAEKPIALILQKTYNKYFPNYEYKLFDNRASLDIEYFIDDTTDWSKRNKVEEMHKKILQLEDDIDEYCPCAVEKHYISNSFTTDFYRIKKEYTAYQDMQCECIEKTLKKVRKTLK